MYDQEAGALWDQRLKQFLLVNGVAVLQINPHDEDSWDACPSLWAQGGKSGADRTFLPPLFEAIGAGKFGPLNPAKTVLRGWSGGAQMVSWLFQVMAMDPSVFSGVNVVAGIMFSGGSYQCYNDPKDPYGNPQQPIGSCKGCTEGGPSHCQGDPKCSSCSVAVQPYCQQCCPRNYTEAYWDDHPDKYSTHPAVFLTQTSTVDNHADLCACRNYYDTLQAHGVRSKLVLVAEADEECFCIGNPANPAAAGSPFSHLCTSPSWGQNCGTMGGQECCISHTMANADMVVPATTFILESL